MSLYRYAYSYGFGLDDEAICPMREPDMLASILSVKCYEMLFS